MSDTTWRYPPDICDLLAAHGILPRPDTHPRVVRDYLSDLYRFEIRRLKSRHLAGEVSKADYVPQVILLRKKYVPLSQIPEQWEAFFASK
jgi:hypothetical protein